MATMETDPFSSEKREASFIYAIYDADGQRIGANYTKMLAAKAQAESLAAFQSLPCDGWRQEMPDTWYMMPHRMFSITVAKV